MIRRFATRDASGLARPLLIIVMLALFAFAAMACEDDDEPGFPSDPTSTPTVEVPTATPEPEEGEAPDGLYGHGKRTGNAHIDALLAAWEAGDVNALAALARLQEQQCVTVLEGLGGPPECLPGVADGTTVRVMAAAACEGYWVYEDGLAALFQGFVEGFDGKPFYLYAAWQAPADQNLPAGHRVLFARSIADNDIFSPQVVLDEEGKVFLYLGGCNPAVEQIPAGDTTFVLEPKDGLPPQTGTGIPAVDRFLQIRERGDAAGLAPLVTTIQVPCKLPGEADYWVFCGTGQPSGTPVPAFPWWGCHGAFSNGGTTEQIALFFANEAGALHYVVRFTPANSLEMFPAHASLAVVFERPDGFAWAAVLDDDGNFYGSVTGCPANAGELLALHFGGGEVLHTAS